MNLRNTQGKINTTKLREARARLVKKGTLPKSATTEDARHGVGVNPAYIDLRDRYNKS